MPARQSFVAQMIDRREDLGNAIALNSSTVNGARLVGPAIAGVLIATGVGGLLFPDRRLQLHGGNRALLAMKVVPAHTRGVSRPLASEIGEGWRYVKESAPIRSLSFKFVYNAANVGK
jgi:hypothetical protein